MSTTLDDITTLEDRKNGSTCARVLWIDVAPLPHFRELEVGLRREKPYSRNCTMIPHLPNGN